MVQQGGVVEDEGDAAAADGGAIDGGGEEAEEARARPGDLELLANHLGSGAAIEVAVDCRV